MGACPSCGRANLEDASFCSSCGVALEVPSPATHELRKTVTIVFCDVTGSTALGEGLDPESLRKLLTRYYETARRAFERHGGTVEKFIGDAVVAVFGIPRVHEDDPLRAVRAVAELRESLAVLDKELERDRGVTLLTRIGVHTGEVMAGDGASGHAMMSGDAGNVAARLEQVAAPGDALISETTYRLVRDAVIAEPLERPLSLKGRTQPVRAFRLEAVHPSAPGHARRMESPLVGRARELTRIRQALEHATFERACHLFTVLGPAGIGKSRLVDEFLRDLGDGVTVLRGRCLPYGEMVAFWPLAEVVAEATGTTPGEIPTAGSGAIAELLGHEPDAAAIAVAVARLIGSGTDAALSVEENRWAARRLFEILAHSRPLVLAFDDLHWAESSFLDLLDHVSDLARDAPILLLCVARPELLDVRPAWGGGKFNAISLLLESLSDDEAHELLVNLLGGSEPPSDLAARILQAAEGNPLFVEESIGMLMDEGHLRVDQGSLVLVDALPEAEIPPTIQALLASRLDLLEPDERDVLGCAAVVGKVFYPAALRELAQAADGDLPRLLDGLVRKQLIVPTSSDLPREEAYRFRHILVRDAAYTGLAKELRGSLHERFATWLEASHAGGGPEISELAGYHLDRAYRYACELGPPDEHARALAAGAVDRLLAAGRRAYLRFDVEAAAKLLGRVDELMSQDDSRRPEMLLDLGSALVSTGEFARAHEAYGRAIESSQAMGRMDMEGRAVLARTETREILEPEGSTEASREAAERWLPIFRELGDDLGLAAAYDVLASIELVHLQREAMGSFQYQAAAHARAAGDRRREAEYLDRWLTALVNGPADRGALAAGVDEYARRLGVDTPVARLATLHARLHLAEMLDDLAEARRLAAEALDTARSIGDAYREVSLSGYCLADVEEVAGNWAVAEDLHRRGLEFMEDAGDIGHESTMAAYLGRALAIQGKDGALRLADQAERTSARDDIVNQIVIRQVRALALARAGEFDRAEALGREAVAIAEQTDVLGSIADAYSDLALILELAGRPADAATSLRRAIEVSERKGDLGRARRDQTRLDELRTR